MKTTKLSVLDAAFAASRIKNYWPDDMPSFIDYVKRNCGEYEYKIDSIFERCNEETCIFEELHALDQDLQKIVYDYLCDYCSGFLHILDPDDPFYSQVDSILKGFLQTDGSIDLMGYIRLTVKDEKESMNLFMYILCRFTYEFDQGEMSKDSVCGLRFRLVYPKK